MLHPVIAIDGPAASGKSTVSRKVASALGFTYVDTGAMYRTFAWQALEKGIAPSSREEVKKLIDLVAFETLVENHQITLKADGIDAASHIREERINKVVSSVAQIPELREYLVNRQRRLRNHAPLVMEGRDVGTVVCTDASLKFFLDADPAVREQRRSDEGIADSLKHRDQQDRTRASAPLTQAADAIPIDSSNMKIDEVVAFILDKVKQKGLQPSGAAQG